MTIHIDVHIHLSTTACLLHVSINKTITERHDMNMLPVVVIVLQYTLALLLLRNMINMRLRLSVVNAHTLAHFNSMIGSQALVAHSYSNPDCSHNFSVYFSKAQACFVNFVK